MDAMAGIRMEDKISEIAGIKLIGPGSIERDRRVVGNLHCEASVFDGQRVSSVELFGVKVARESA